MRVEAAVQDVILRTSLYGMFGGLFLLRTAEQQDRNVRRCLEYLIKDVDFLTLRQPKIDHDACDANIRSVVQSTEPGGAASAPFDRKRSIPRLRKQIQD